MEIRQKFYAAVDDMTTTLIERIGVISSDHQQCIAGLEFAAELLDSAVENTKAVAGVKQ